MRLFDRIGNRIQLTRAGQFLLDHACKIIDAYQNLDFDMKKLTAKAEGELPSEPVPPSRNMFSPDCLLISENNILTLRIL